MLKYKMTELNLEEKQIVIAILIAIMEADGIIDPHETDYLDKVISLLNMSEVELDTIDELDFNLIVSYFKSFETNKKNFAKSLFLEMAKCDGYADPRELEIINRLGS